MASIKGIELKNVKDFRGHEGEDLVQGDVYYKGKKVGYYSQDAWGGMDIFDLDWQNLPKELMQEIKDITDNYIGGKLFKKLDDLYDKTYKISFVHPEHKGYEYLFEDLLELLDHEKLYKKYSETWGVKTIYIVYKSLFERQVCGAILQPQYKDKTYFKYNSLKNFVID
jgi:hypothetical protein